MTRLADDMPLRHLIRMAAALFLSYLTVAMALPAVAVQVSGSLHMGNIASGLAVGIAFLSTICTRAWAGRLTDERGGKPTLLLGLAIYLAATLVCLLSALPAMPTQLAYAVLLAGRLLLGVGESLALVGILGWGMAMMGPARSGRVMALVGMAMYGAFALGGPLGLWLSQLLGFAGLMAVSCLLPLAGALILASVPATAPAHAGTRPPFKQVLGRIWQPGAVVLLQGVGFAALGAFFPLYFIANGWDGAGFGLTCFGLGFVAVRIFGGGLPDRLGGIPVALASLAVETLGQALLWLAPSPILAMAGAALTGIGCSLIFPAMGLEAVNRVPMHLRGTAIGGFAAFQDLAYGATGPLAGLIADHFGHARVFLAGALAALLGLLLVMAMMLHRSSKAR
ncbi:MFS transporter [Corticibacter populi]|uniref:Uncharacterized MFS-type transporter D8I35_01100 n=1 Tax=Corticibacter populi TaxID=1550736 RepID=A0A3M6QXQ5_9BURK|nr:arabinose transporter [Corticibacter populi]RMX07764.1 MFS transporter [Corticibacter populi]RZS34986.1 putative MFS family arabinose efflux permease [Corticibacter populi]